MKKVIIIMGVVALIAMVLLLSMLNNNKYIKGRYFLKVSSFI